MAEVGGGRPLATKGALAEKVNMVMTSKLSREAARAWKGVAASNDPKTLSRPPARNQSTEAATLRKLQAVEPHPQTSETFPHISKPCVRTLHLKLRRV